MLKISFLWTPVCLSFLSPNSPTSMHHTSSATKELDGMEWWNFFFQLLLYLPVLHDVVFYFLFHMCLCVCYRHLSYLMELQKSWIYFLLLIYSFFAIGKQKGDKIAGHFVLCTQHCLEGLIRKGEQFQLAIF